MAEAEMIGVKEPDKIYKHSLECSACKNRFSIESKEENNGKLGLPDMFCPKCGKKEVRLDPSSFTTVLSSLDSQRKLNTEASSYALQMAAAQRKADEAAGLNKMVTVVSKQKGSEGKTAIVPEKVIESLEEKIKIELE